jgi:ribulose-phosphate 3-epimerase
MTRHVHERPHTHAVNPLLRQRLVAPSILSADFTHLADEVGVVLDAGARVIHVDVMDGHFVPNITIGLPVVAALSPFVHGHGALLDVHLMIERPELYVERFAEAGADVVTVHQEACVHLHRTLGQIREAGAAAGVALNPATPVDTLVEARHHADLVLVMSVDPGFGGQSFIPQSLDKLRAARALLADEVALEVDGGVDAGNAAALVAAGANLLVAGSAVFAGPETASRIAALGAAIAG